MKDRCLQDTADGSKTLYSEAYEQTFHSRRGALSEARHVFLEASGVGKRLRKDDARVLEVGFGAGLNFFITADACLKGTRSLHYVALEKNLLQAEDFSSLGYREVVAHQDLFDAFFAWRLSLPVEPAAGLYTFSFVHVTLELLLGEAAEQILGGYFDAVYLDAFSPEANPELWSECFLATLYQALAPGGILSTYSVKGEVRRRLQGLGFKVEKRPGPPGGKREMLIAIKSTAVS